MRTERYLITLKPLAPFFFGAEETFGEGKEARYRAVSTRFPAQSALIGMLRRTMLIAARHMSLHKRGEWIDSAHKKTGRDDPNYLAAVALAGKGVFRYDAPADLGIIQRLSPLMIRYEGAFCIPAPKHMTLRPRYDAAVRLQRPGLPEAQPALYFEGFKAKEGLPDGLLRDDGTELEYDEIYETISTVGIKKSRTGQTEEDAFFLKESYALKEDATFAFLLETSESLPQKMLDCRVELGADRSAFRLQALSYDGPEPIEKLAGRIPPAGELGAVVALSELFVSPEAAGHCEMIVGKRVRRRQIRHQSRENKYAFAKSEAFYRYEPGTVLYTRSPEILAQKLALPHLQKAGVNIFTTKKGES